MANNIKNPVINGFKLCYKCNLSKPVDMFSRGRAPNYLPVPMCKSCKCEWSKSYRKRADVIEYNRKRHKEYMSIPKNRDAANVRARRYNKTEKYKALKNSLRREWSAIQKQKAVDYKGGKCICCGYSGCLAAMDFHHRDPSQKEGYGTGALKTHWTFEKNKPELDKCELVCVRCHREIHANYRELPS